MRAFWWLGHGVPFHKPNRILYAYYPNLKQVDTERPAHDDAFYDIVFLGGSVLHRDWTPIERILREQLADNGHRNVRIFNLAVPAHTSRDSWLKYASFRDVRFELVVFYHGVNETRANNAPPQLFREDYAHYSWYKSVNMLAAYHGTAVFALPYTLRYLAIGLQYAVTQHRYVPTHRPRQSWMDYGRDSRSAVSFKHNLGALLDLAAQRGDQMLTMTFATYVPDNYSLKAFKEKRLDYGLHLTPIELWGAREHVVKTIAIQNEIVRSLADQHEDVLFLDQASLITGSTRHFNDLCHLTVAGASKFVEYLLRVILPTFQSS